MQKRRSGRKSIWVVAAGWCLPKWIILSVWTLDKPCQVCQCESQILTNMNIPVDTGLSNPTNCLPKVLCSILSPTPHICHHVRQTLTSLTGFCGLCNSSGLELTLPPTPAIKKGMLAFLIDKANTHLHKYMLTHSSNHLRWTRGYDVIIVIKGLIQRKASNTTSNWTLSQRSICAYIPGGSYGL